MIGGVGGIIGVAMFFVPPVCPKFASRQIVSS